MELARPSRKTNGVGVQVGDTQICVVMVGLPARGKSLIAQKAQRYLKWLSIDAQVFNVGNYRRKGAAQPTADFFDVTNAEGERVRRAAAEAAVNDMIMWFKKKKGIIAILDATNSTKKRRRWIKDTCDKEGIETLFVESKCDDEDLIMSNILEVKTTSPDYVGQDPEQAAQDFRNRIRNYEKIYETIDDTENDLTYLKIMDVGKQCIINAIHDYLQSRVVYYLMNLHIKRRSIWLSRHGESQYNVTGQIGGDANLSPRGEKYALKLPQLVKESFEGEEHPLTVWTSTLKRTIATARHLPKEWNQLQWKALDELDSGVCDNMTYAEIAADYPEDFAARDQDKYNYRYRGGESYRDVVIRLEPIIMELERSENILIVTHQAILRCIYAYFMKEDQEKSPWLNVPLHCLIKLTPRAYGTEKVVYKANIDAVSTWRGKGSTAKHEDPTEETESLAKVAAGHFTESDTEATLSGSGAGVHSTSDVVADITAELEKFPAHFTYGIKDPPKLRQVILNGERFHEILAREKKEAREKEAREKAAMAGSADQGGVANGSEIDKKKELNIDTTIPKDVEITDASEVNKENQKMKED